MYRLHCSSLCTSRGLAFLLTIVCDKLEKGAPIWGCRCITVRPAEKEHASSDKRACLKLQWLSITLYFAAAICKGMRVMLQQPTSRVPQLQRGSPRAAGLMHPWNRLILLRNSAQAVVCLILFPGNTGWQF